MVEVFNTSGATIELTVGEDRHIVQNEAGASFDYPSGNWGEVGEVDVCRNNNLTRYTVPFPPDDYYHGVALLFLRSRIRVQLDRDGRVWILKRGEEFPVPADAAQPEPFPLNPTEIGAC